MKKTFLCFSLFAFVAAFLFSIDAMELYRNGLNLDRNGRREEAMAQYNSSIQICLKEIDTVQDDAKKLDAYTIASWCLINLGSYNEVLKYCAKALKIGEDRDHRIIEVMGEAYFYLGKYDRALPLFEEYVNRYYEIYNYRPDRAYFFIGEIYAKRGKHNKAEIAYLLAIRNTTPRNNPQIATWWYNLAREKEACMDKDRPQDKKDVIDAYWQVLRFSPRYPGVQEKIKAIQALR